MRKPAPLFHVLLLLGLVLTGCQVQIRGFNQPTVGPTALIPDTGAAARTAAPVAAAMPLPSATAPAALLVSTPVEVTGPATRTAATTATDSANDAAAATAVAMEVASASPTPLPTLVVRLPAEQWKDWPALPQVPAGAREIYQRGLAQGSDPRAFSILGDCQSQPEEFMGVYDSDPDLVAALPAPLRETVANFAGSFDRYSPTVKDGTTEGALLWVQWNDNKEKKCKFGETPLDCELRVHRPSIVLIHVGTHWETRNRQYLEKVVDILLEHGALPIIATKADNREKDERVNHNLASLAETRGLPLWNFWSTVQHLPDNGLRRGSDTYLSKEAILIHRLGALQALDAVWRAVQ